MSALSFARTMPTGSDLLLLDGAGVFAPIALICAFPMNPLYAVPIVRISRVRLRTSYSRMAARG